LLDIIECNFEQDFCHFQNGTTNSYYSLFRSTSQQLAEQGILGPDGDYDNNKDKFFVITSNYQAQEVLPETVAYLQSPTFMASEHPVECFSFFFFFGV
jgi:hypothetical protein